jgi:hypothetical protein
MKKLLLFFVLVTTLFSCSSDDNTPNTSTLQKVVFYRDSANERHWNINNNLLTNITLADGTIAEEFIYDIQNRLIRDTKFANGVVTETDIITYNADDTISTINGLPYTFNAATRTYAYSYGSNFTISCTVNDDMLAVDFTRTGVGAGVYHMTYDSGNMTSFEKITSGTTEVLKNFHFNGVYGTNPIHDSVLAVARVKSLTDPGFFVDSQASAIMADGFDKGSSDPYYYNIGEVVDHNYSQFGVEILDSNNNFVDYYTFATYYYQ